MDDGCPRRARRTAGRIRYQRLHAVGLTCRTAVAAMRRRAQLGERVTLHDLRGTPAYGKSVGHGLLDLFVGRTGLARRLDVIVCAGLGTPGADVDVTVENGLVQTVDEGTP